jgi:hypothetical protein
MGLFSSIGMHFEKAKPFLPVKLPATVESVGKAGGIMGKAVRTDSANAAYNVAHWLRPDLFEKAAPVGAATRQAAQRSEHIVAMGARYDAHVVGEAAQKVGDITVRQVVMAPINAVSWTIGAAIALPREATFAARSGLGNLFTNLGNWIKPR